MNAIVKHEPVSRRRSTPIAGSRLLPFLAACLATLLALPVNAAIVWPENPLQTGATVPPNIMFILDNSGSMAYVSMPFDTDDGDLDDNPTDRSYLNNTIYYDPSIDYEPWMTADGKTRKTGGTDVTAVFKSTDLADTSDGTRDLRNSDESIFYVPHDGVTSSTDPDDFDRYQIGTVDGEAKVMRGTGDSITLDSDTWNNQDINVGAWWRNTFTVPTGTTSLRIRARNGSGGNADLYVKYAADPTTTDSDYSDTGSGNTETVTIDNPTPGVWHIGVYNSDVNSGCGRRGCSHTATKVDNEDIDAYAYKLDLVEAVPSTRTQDEELQNIATWYSYYRTRLKMAKASASEAFASLGRGYRVGYTPINGRSPNLSADGTGTVIPVDKDDGRFEDDADSGTTNRTEWYEALQEEETTGTTPLRSALDAVGQYYTRTDDLGPWGNGPGEPQLSCRPSFSILTTDGYWNDKGAGNTANTGYFYESYTGNITTDQDADGRKVSLADIAMYYYKTDLRPPGDDGLENDVPPSTADPADWQHMVTFGLSIGLKGTLTVTDPPASNSTDWPNPMDAENKDRIDDLWHAAVNGHGSFVAASNPTEFAQGLIAALSAVADRTGSASNVSTNSTSFQDNSAVYQASYKFGLWTGEVQAYKASADGVESTPLWSASDMVPDYGERTIVTWNGSTGVDFPTDSQKSALGGDDNVNYIKGDQSKEKQKGGALRTRTDTVLGDIVNSSPAYSTDSKSLFVGANDGMLHAFDSETGIEQFAYVPAGIRFTSVSGKTGLDKLSDPTYLHGWFVDGPVVVSQKDKTGGVNYLIGALGRGGKGLFALDVTDPSTFSASNVKWDLTGSAAPVDMGEVLGEPLIVKFNDGTTGIIASNGVNSSGGVAALFVLNIETGSVVKEFKVDSSGDNGLSAPRGWDDDGNGTVDYVYAGDLKGNLWKFDLSASSNTGWKVANSDSPMFVATDASDKRQPITAGLGLARDPTTSKRWVFIGTGKFLEDGDILTTDVQSMYGIIDDGTVVTGRTSGGDGDLQKRQIVAIDTTGKYRGFEAHGSLDGDVKGWYIDLLKPPSATAQGERIVNRPIVSGTVLITASMVPPTDDATCDAGGSGYINALDAFTGTSTAQPYFDANGNGDFTDDTLGSGTSEVPIGSVDLGVGMPTLPTIIDNLLVVGGSKATMGQIKVNPQGAGARRISWREITRD